MFSSKKSCNFFGTCSEAGIRSLLSLYRRRRGRRRRAPRPPATGLSMKFTLSWLKQHLDTNANLATIVDTLTKVGLEVEHVHDPAAALKDFVIAEVLEAHPHPNADRLRVCFVEIGRGKPVQVVCGA